MLRLKTKYVIFPHNNEENILFLKHDRLASVFYIKLKYLTNFKINYFFEQRSRTLLKGLLYFSYLILPFKFSQEYKLLSLTLKVFSIFCPTCTVEMLNPFHVHLYHRRYWNLIDVSQVVVSWASWVELKVHIFRTEFEL